jgi:hypothetical protein
VSCYNRLKKNTTKVEYDLISGELKEIDLQLERAEHAINWNSEGSFTRNNFLF